MRPKRQGRIRTPTSTELQQSQSMKTRAKVEIDWHQTMTT